MEIIKHNWFLITMLVLATIISFVWLFVFNRKKLNAKWWEVLILVLLHTTYGVLTVKFFAILEVGFNFEKAGSMSLFGGIFFMPIMYYVYAKIKKLPLSLVFDIFVVPLATTLLLARINCLHAGCCQGIIINDEKGIRWPAREVDLAIHTLFLILAISWIMKNKSNGLAYPAYMAAYGIIRFFNEWFRENSGSNVFHIGHVWAIVSSVIGLLLMLLLLVCNKDPEEKGANDENQKA